MRQTAVVIAPGRGTYNQTELNYLARHHADKTQLLAAFDADRREQDLPGLTDLDGATRFDPDVHLRGEHASALIYAAAYADYLSIDRDRFDIVGVTGNSMGWYIALACAGVFEPLSGLKVVGTMGALLEQAMIGGQIIYPVTGPDWVPDAGQRQSVLGAVADINGTTGRVLGLSIDLGGTLVLAGNEAGLTAFEAAMPRVDDRFPMRLARHAAFHSPLQADVARQGQSMLPLSLFDDPRQSLIDGRGIIWHPHASDLAALREYTLGHQVVEPYDFAGAVGVAAREMMPDVFIVLGPGKTLGGAVGQSLIAQGWRGLADKAGFQAMDPPRVIMMGDARQRVQVSR